MATYLTTQEVAERLHINVSTVRRWLRTKQLKGTLCGRTGYRIFEKDLQAFLHQQNNGSCVVNNLQQIRQSPCPYQSDGTSVEKDPQDHLNEQHLRALLDLSSEAMLIWKPSGRIMYWNKGAERLYGFSQREALAQNRQSLLTSCSAFALSEASEELSQTGNWEGELTGRCKDGSQIIIKSQQRLIKQVHSNCLILEVDRDTSQEKRLQAELKQAQSNAEWWRYLINRIPANVWTAAPDGKITYVSEVSCNYLGCCPEDLLGWNYIKTIHPDDQELALQVWQRAIITGNNYELVFRWRRYDGEYRWFIIEAQPIKDKDGQVIAWFGATLNIDAQKRTEEALRASIEAYRCVQEELATSTALLLDVIEGTPDVILTKDRQSKFTMINQATTNLFGATREQILGHYDRDFLPAEIAQTLVETDQRVMETQTTEVIEETLPTPQGPRVYLTTKSPLCNIHNEVVGLIVVARDITERKENERQKDIFMGVVSHELKTPVTSLKAFAQVLHKRFLKAGDTSSAQILLKMDTQINKLTTLITDLLDVTRIEAGQFQFTRKTFAFDELVKETVEEMQRITTRHQLCLEGSSQREIYGDRERIGQVLINLLSNAIKYSLHGQKILIKTQVESEAYVTLCVQDFGVGIPEDKRAHLFERFYRVSDQAFETIPGLGLGLYISAEIIKRHGGTIWVESEVDAGSTFCFRLPLQQTLS